jgi:hypothetical protein
MTLISFVLLPDKFTRVFEAVFHLIQSNNNFTTATVEPDYVAAI